jgi:hypothetical protein
VPLVEIAGRRVVAGGNDIAPGPVSPEKIPDLLLTLQRNKFAHKEQKVS